MEPAGAAERAPLRDLVRRGYDAISAAYRDDAGRPNPTTAEQTDQYRGWIDELAVVLPTPARVLDLGCGNGLPASRLLVEKGYEVVGLDISPVQIERARSLVPGATFVCADLAAWDAPPASFDAVVSLYALIHVPLLDQQDLFPRIHQWLRPGGWALAIVGHEPTSGIDDYLGAPMFWEHAGTDSYLAWFAAAGLRPVWHRFIPEGDAGHTLILARAS